MFVTVTSILDGNDELSRMEYVYYLQSGVCKRRGVFWRPSLTVPLSGSIPMAKWLFTLNGTVPFRWKSRGRRWGCLWIRFSSAPQLPSWESCSGTGRALISRLTATCWVIFFFLFLDIAQWVESKTWSCEAGLDTCVATRDVLWLLLVCAVCMTLFCNFSMDYGLFKRLHTKNIKNMKREYDILIWFETFCSITRVLSVEFTLDMIAC